MVGWNGERGLDEFYAGYEAAEPPCRFKGLGSAVLFPDEDLADRSLEQLRFDVPAPMRAALSVKPVTITYAGRFTCPARYCAGASSSCAIPAATPSS